MAGLRIAKAADEQIRTIELWWAENRPMSPWLFSNELADALDRIVAEPRAGASYPGHPPRDIRRLLLTRSRYHVYFSYDVPNDLVEVRAVWHAVRGGGPPLR